MLFQRKPRVQCWYCCTRLCLLPPAPTRAALAKGKARAVEPDQDGPVAVGTRDEFWCGECGQITRHDQNGDVVSEAAAFFDSRLNDDSFAKRGSPSRHRLPTSFPSTSTTPFCRQCLANQSLQLHLLASYPSDSDSDAEDGASDFPPLEEYRLSLDARYPLVCAACTPAVEGTIRERDYRVKAQALGWRLRESQRAREREERVSEERMRREGRRRVVEGWAWRARGAAWALTGAATAGACCCCLLDPALSSAPPALLSTPYRQAVVPLALLSLFWSCWDPTWAQLRLERARGRNMGVQRRREYLAIQMLAYLARLVGAVLFQFRLVSSPNTAPLAAATILLLTLVALLSALYLPRLKPPPPIRLTSHPSSTSSANNSRSGTPTRVLFPPADPLEPLAHLSLSRPGSLLALSPPATPTMPHARGGSPLGGATRPRERARLPSLSLRPWARTQPATAADAPQAMDVDAPSSAAAAGDDADNSMDWAPLPPPSSTSPPRARVEHVTFARQRFVPPDLRKPTGLEGMFERVVAVREQEAEGVRAMEGVELAKPGEKEGGWWKGWLGR